MKRLAFFVLISLTIIGFGACQQKTKLLRNNSLPADTVHNSRNSLDWAGQYSGILPCTDCEGIQTSLKINENGTYVLSTSQPGIAQDSYRSEGSFVWNQSGSVIELSNEPKYLRFFLVGENVLILLDNQGKRHKGSASEKYRLLKMNAQMQLSGQANIAGKWVLTELNGKPLQDQKVNGLIYIEFNNSDSTVAGSGGCNRFFGQYKLSDGMRIQFSKLGTTLMACDHLATEAEFMQMLEKADNYTIANGLLKLNKARMAPLAVFRAEGPN